VVRSPVFKRGYVNCPSVYGVSRAFDIAPSPGDSTMPEPTRKRETGRPHLPALTAGPLSVRTARPRVEPRTSSGRANPAERRDAASRQALLRRIVAEYDEMPALCLTAAQGQRLFGLREDIFERVFSALVDAAILRRDGNGVYRRNGGRP